MKDRKNSCVEFDGQIRWDGGNKREKTTYRTNGSRWGYRQETKAGNTQNVHRKDKALEFHGIAGI